MHPQQMLTSKQLDAYVKLMEPAEEAFQEAQRKADEEYRSAMQAALANHDKAREEAYKEVTA